MSTVDTEKMLANALRKLLPLAVKDLPEWISDDAAKERHRAYTAAQIALMEYDEREPASVTPLSSVARPGDEDSLALAS